MKERNDAEIRTESDAEKKEREGGKQWSGVRSVTQYSERTLLPFVLPDPNYLICLWTFLLSSQTHFSRNKADHDS